MSTRCACGHPLDHENEPCLHPECPCQNGMAIEMVQLIVAKEISGTLARLLAVTEVAFDLESRLVDKGNGMFGVQVKKRGLTPTVYTAN